uniref:Uncharacterized protein n=1 Tax=Acrobeloides nanus TaxID=290746 RepID=A0A914DSV2_9BILA
MDDTTNLVYTIVISCVGVLAITTNMCLFICVMKGQDWISNRIGPGIGLNQEQNWIRDMTGSETGQEKTGSGSGREQDRIEADWIRKRTGSKTELYQGPD